MTRRFYAFTLGWRGPRLAPSRAMRAGSGPDIDPNVQNPMMLANNSLRLNIPFDRCQSALPGDFESLGSFRTDTTIQQLDEVPLRFVVAP